MDRKAFKDISLYIMSNAGKEFSAENIASFYYKKTNIKKPLSNGFFNCFFISLRRLLKVMNLRRRYLSLLQRILHKKAF